MILNTVFFGLVWNRAPSIINNIAEMANTVFSGIYFIEAAIKIIGLGIRYFYAFDNVFDFVLMLIGVSGTIV